MSISAGDHYKVALAKRHFDEKSSELEEAQLQVREIESEVDELRRELEQAEERLRGVEETRDSILQENAAACEQVKLATAKAEEKPKPLGEVQIRPETGLPEGEKIIVHSEEHKDCTMKMESVREFMEQGDLEQARELEREVCDMLKRFGTVIDPRAFGVVQACQVSAALFCPPKSQPDEAEIEETFKWARENPERTDATSMRNLFLYAGLDDFLGIPCFCDSFPRHLNPIILKCIMVHRCELEDMVKESAMGNEDDSNEREGENEGEDNQENQEDEEEQDEDESPSPHFKMDDEAWDAIETAIRNRIAIIKEESPNELSLPREDSAPIARYNPSAHFCFQSESALSSVAELDDALACCKLRSEQQGQQLPFELSVHGRIEGLDVDGDIIAMCGDSHYSDIYSSQTFVAYQPVWDPCNLESTKDCDGLKDRESNASTIVMWDSIEPTLLYEKHNKGEPREYFSECLVDTENGLIWASSERTGTVHCFTTSATSSQQQNVGLLAFDSAEKKAQKGFMGGLYNMTRCGDRIVGSAGTNRLSLWKTQEAIDKFPSSEAKDDSGMPERKKPKKEKYKGLQPQLIVVEDDRSLKFGDVQRQSGSQVVVAPARQSKSCAIRLFDVATESVVGLYCGSQSDVSIGKQYCVDSHNLLFSAENYGTGFVWDIRTFQPAFLLHTGTTGSQILGVPGTNNCCAFTFGTLLESILCWDLRMPGSHAYTMSTGNSYVSSLEWHNGTCSLFAATSTHHRLTYGNCGEYMYGEPVSLYDEYEEFCRVDYWPKRAQHERNYFGSGSWHSGSDPLLLQYAFKNGKPM